MNAAANPAAHARPTPPAILCLLCIATGLPFYLLFAYLLTQALVLPDIDLITRPAAMALLRNILMLVCIGDIALIPMLWRRRNEQTVPQWFYYWIALAHSTALGAVALAMGPYTSSANMAAVSALVVGMALLPRRVVVHSFIFTLAATVVYQGLVDVGKLPYAPLIVPGTFLGRMPVEWYGEFRAIISYLGLSSGLAWVLWMFSRADRLRTQLLDQSRTDGLTGLSNRRYFMERLESELRRRQRYGFPVALVVGDADHFKKVNDTYGHAAGDEVLREIGRILARVRRPTDVAARLGGEEFALLLPDCSLEHARAVSERLRQELEAHEFKANDQRFRVTLSMGVVEAQDNQALVLLKQADLHLYEAKRQGRNRVVAASANGGGE